MPPQNSRYSSANNTMHEMVSSYFLGPRAENKDLLSKMFGHALDNHANIRLEYHPEDGDFISEAVKSSPGYEDGVNDLLVQFTILTSLLNAYSIPFFSPRYNGHMTGDVSMPAVIGHLATTLWNPNNVVFEASPITTLLEIDVGNQLCDLLGYRIDTSPIYKGKEPVAWGHITCDGTVANLESLWAARNLKLYPLAVREAMEPGKPLDWIADTFKVATCTDVNREKLVLFKDLTPWQMLNLRPEEVLSIGERLLEEYNISSSFLNDALYDYLVQSTGMAYLEAKYGYKPIQYLVSSTKHYSWPKSAAICGLGAGNMVNVPVDVNARVDIVALEEALNKLLKAEQAVFAVVAVMGTTEEGAVDPLPAIVELRDKFRNEHGMSFLVHADAAWGGYFTTMIKPKKKIVFRGGPEKPNRDYVPSVTMRDCTRDAMEALKHADSITIDPHKSGYIPYPAGGLCYRDGRMRFLVSWTAPYLADTSGSAEDTTIGTYGVEGSKPGAPAAAVYLHHQVVGLHDEGHGGLLGEVMFGCRRISAWWASISDKSTPYTVVPFNPLRDESSPDSIEKEKEFIRKRIIGVLNEELVKDKEAMIELRALGSDLNINLFSCNFMLDGKPNQDVEEANFLNHRIIKKFSIWETKQPALKIPFYLSSTTLEAKNYGTCATRFKERLGLETKSNMDLFALRNVAMSPFQPAGDYLNDIMGVFIDELKKETETSIKRNTVSPDKHSFTMQGTDKLYLAYRPHFYKQTGRMQLILEVEITEMDKYQAAQQANPGEVYTLTTTEDIILSELIHLDGRNFEASVTGKDLDLPSVRVTGIRVVKNRPLNSMFRDPEFPERFTPFYVYGTAAQPHIDHMLLVAPNVVLSGGNVTLSCQLTDEQLAEGALLRIDNLHENAVQPVDDKIAARIFVPGKTYNVTIYRDPRPAEAQGPGLAQVNPDDEIGKGTMTLNGSLYIDTKEVNNTFDEAHPDAAHLVKGWHNVGKGWVTQGMQGVRETMKQVQDAPDLGALDAVKKRKVL